MIYYLSNDNYLIVIHHCNLFGNYDSPYVYIELDFYKQIMIWFRTVTIKIYYVYSSTV